MPTAIEDEATRHCRDRIHTIAAYYWAEAQACYPQALANQPLPPLKFNLTGSCAGQVQFIKQRARVQPLCIRFNLDIARHNADSCHETTVAHEVAHAVAVLVHGRRALGHGHHWRRIMSEFGQPANRCHQYDLSAVRVRRQQRFPYRCRCDEEHWLTSVRHRRQQRGTQQYYCRRCGELLVFSKASRSTA